MEYRWGLERWSPEPTAKKISWDIFSTKWWFIKAEDPWAGCPGVVRGDWWYPGALKELSHAEEGPQSIQKPCHCQVKVVFPSSKTLPVRWLGASSRAQVIRAVNCVWLSFWKLGHWWKWKCFVLVDRGDICKLRETGVLQACDLYKLRICFSFS